LAFRTISSSKRKYVVIDLAQLQSFIESNNDEVINVLTRIAFGGVDENFLFEIEDNQAALFLVLNRGTGPGSEASFDSRQHTTAIVVGPATHTDVQMRLACSCFLDEQPVNEYLVSWENPGWTPILNGWLAGKSPKKQVNAPEKREAASA